MSLSSIKFIAFDLDGTLLDSVPDLAIAADQAAQSLGYPAVSETQVRDYVGNGADILIGRSLSRSLEIDPMISADTLKEARVRFDDFYAATGHKSSHLYEDVLSTLSALFQAGYSMAVVTNKPLKFVPEILAQHGIAEFFCEVIGGDSFPVRKPDPVALNWLMEKYSVTAEQFLMVGDSKNDILAARNARCLSFGLTYGYNHGVPISESNPDYVADNVNELLKLLIV
ncbi:phosphoglycolate phosphatase [Vibrio sp. RC27]